MVTMSVVPTIEVPPVRFAHAGMRGQQAPRRVTLAKCFRASKRPGFLDRIEAARQEALSGRREPLAHSFLTIASLMVLFLYLEASNFQKTPLARVSARRYIFLLCVFLF